jgi:dimethylargininase
LKSAVTAVSDDTLLLNPQWAPAERFANYRLVEVHPDERAGANVVRVRDHLLYSAAFPRTLERLVQANARVTTVDVSELAKAEGAVTCCSLILETIDGSQA